jgi:catechol 2,3-dioxygenase-like lactoylglutathione lyase family enzyme
LAGWKPAVRGGYFRRWFENRSAVVPDALIKGVEQIGFASADPARLVAFYRDVMGFPVLFEAGGMTFLQAGATRLMICAAQDGQGVAGDVFLYYEPSDWSAMEAKLEAAGIVFAHATQIVQREEKREHALRFFEDPDGRKIALMGWRASV